VGGRPFTLGKIMKHIAILMLSGWPLLAPAHPCPFDWNIEFSKPVAIHGTTMADFAQKLNEAVNKETNGRVKTTFIFISKPDSFAKVPENSPFARQMDTLIQRYAEITAQKPNSAYGTAPEDVEFPANVPIACVLDRTSPNYKETKEGAILTLGHNDFQCRAYKINSKFLDYVKEQREDPIPKGVQPVPYLFARISGMMGAFYSLPIKEQSIIDGVTLYIPEERVVLVIETKTNHEKMTKIMQEKHLLEIPSPEASDKNKQSPNKTRHSNHH
jgi:hypothetical protein